MSEMVAGAEGTPGVSGRVLDALQYAGKQAVLALPEEPPRAVHDMLLGSLELHRAERDEWVEQMKERMLERSWFYTGMYTWEDVEVGNREKVCLACVKCSLTGEDGRLETTVVEWVVGRVISSQENIDELIAELKGEKKTCNGKAPEKEVRRLGVLFAWCERCQTWYWAQVE